MSHQEHSELPNGWRYSTVGKSCNILAGYGFPERLQGKTAGDFPFFKVGDISESWKRGEVHLTKANHYLNREEAAEIRARPLPKNTTVFAKIGAAIALNRRAILSEPALVDNNVMGLFPVTEALDYKFLFHFICTVKLDELSRATTVPSVRKSDIEQIKLPVPPIDEQHRIVAEIEKQFTRLDAGVSALKRAQANLKRYRAAVLKAACEGKLVPTEAELAGRDRSYESGSELLTRILAERRKNWSGRGKYKEPAVPDTTNLPKLPKGWVWATVEQITENFDGRRVPLKSTDRDKRSGQYPYYGASGIIDDIDDFLFDGDYLLIAEDGANLLSRSTPIAFKATGKFWVNNHAHIVQTCGDIPLVYLSIFLNGKDLSFSVTGSAQPKMTQSALNKIPIPIPPLAEQTRIVSEVERRLSVVEELDAAVSVNLQRAVRLRQSILQKAFAGELCAYTERNVK